MGSRRSYLSNLIAEISQKLDHKGFTANHDGNISARLDDVLLATPTSESKASIKPEMVITLDMEGKKIEGIGRPFSEIKLHLSAYRARPDANAVVHAHPPFVTARGLVNQPIYPALPEAIVSIGDCIPVTPFAMPGAPENDKLIHDGLQIADVIMMTGNGILAIGDDLEQAWLRLELVEHLAKIEYYAMQMGQPMTLAQEHRDTLLKKRASIGLGPQNRQEKIAALQEKALREKEARQQWKEELHQQAKTQKQETKSVDTTQPPSPKAAETEASVPIDPTRLEELVLDEVKKIFQGNS